MAEITEDRVKNLIYAELPCATNKICTQVHEVEERLGKRVTKMEGTLRWVTFGVLGIIIMLLINLINAHTSFEAAKVEMKHVQDAVQKLERKIEDSH